MKQLRYRLLIMLAALMLLPTGVGAAEAQKDLKIQDVFTRYGKKRNVTMVELSNEMLETYGMTRAIRASRSRTIRKLFALPANVWKPISGEHARSRR